MKRRRARIHEFTVGWICALPVELTAAREVLDEEYERLDDVAQYTLGRIGHHNVVVACLPAGQLGTNSAAAVAVHMQNSFPALQYGFMVGIAGGVPSQDVDIRLGDVVISHPHGRFGGVVQYDFGKTGSGGQHFPNGSLNSPHPVLLQAVAIMRSSVSAIGTNVLLRTSGLNERNIFPRPAPETDKLYHAAYDHVTGETCDGCLEGKILQRSTRASQDVVIHYGTVASGNQVIKDGLTRDRISDEYDGVLCFEMEAAGLMNIFPCLVVRGICDYADSHKNKGWQPYAAATAAACAREVLSFVPTASRNLNDDLPARSTSVATDASNYSLGVSRLDESSASMGNHHPATRSNFDPSSLYTKTLLTVEKQRSYLESLRFEEIDFRHATIQDAHSQTCFWLLDRPEYKDWLFSDNISEHHGFLWIRGNPGSGKSTLMKFALASTKKTMTKDIVIKFFFNARGNELEKTVLGMYRSLLFQLLDELRDLREVFALQPIKELVDQSEQPFYIWEVGTLQSLFGHAVTRLGTRSLICFVDALDECDEDQIRSMIAFFEHLGDLAASTHLRLRTCFSSRHYPHITIEHSISLILDDQKGHENDIAIYVNSKLNGAHSKVLRDVQQEICERSSGIFLWVVLVVQILKRDFDRGQTQVLKKRLKEIPDDLDKMFDAIITRDDHDVDRLLLCLQWILFAGRSLAPLELFHAILFGVEPDSLEDLDPVDLDACDDQTLQNFVVSSSKGLAEVTKGTPKTVQFIHESVRDYLFKTNSLRKLRTDFASNFSGSSHEWLKGRCQHYIDMASSHMAGKELDLRISKSQRDSSAYLFLDYAVRYILFHADAAAGHGVDQKQFVEEFPYTKWMVLSNLVVEDQNRRYALDETPLYIFANEGLPHLIRIEARKVPSIDIRGGFYGYPLNAAVASRSAEAIEALLITEENRPYPEGEALYATPAEWRAAIREFSTRYTSPRDQNLLLSAVRNRDVHLVKVLLNVKKIDIECSDSRGRTAISEAAILGSADVIKLLLATGRVNVDHREGSGRTPLSLAAQGGHEAAVALLLETDQVDIESQDVYSWTPISWATSYGHAAVTTVLYDAWRRKTTHAGNPLDIARLGLHRQNYMGVTPLLNAIEAMVPIADVINVVRFLTSINQVDLEATNLVGETPLGVVQRLQRRDSLNSAKQRGLKTIADLLLQAQNARRMKSSQSSKCTHSSSSRNG